MLERIEQLAVCNTCKTEQTIHYMAQTYVPTCECCGDHSFDPIGPPKSIPVNNQSLIAKRAYKYPDNWPEDYREGDI